MSRCHSHKTYLVDVFPGYKVSICFLSVLFFKYVMSIFVMSVHLSLFGNLRTTEQTLMKFHIAEYSTERRRTPHHQFWFNSDTNDGDFTGRPTYASVHMSSGTHWIFTATKSVANINCTETQSAHFVSIYISRNPYACQYNLTKAWEHPKTVMLYVHFLTCFLTWIRL
jgi:hypothetical protein